ncbi:glycine--tRNA ligase subunit beta [Cyanobium sp. Morenito 9A2]|uniref:glycine--tRNA ligase subunit beta n=1 Tax=Cyanobium sp. Morenito 9A2 TaxID=2823718 RepID=UPI0020CCB478|nr:glycine--tRNA ligase subunit beta [Cyanobium sp. Morenito 9A2]MCP9850532.1 glycine--tRNA ligase subunit beta [Cyanobium sp. Morenito 9A2]
MATFLLEIGTEELPADFVRLALPQLEAAVRRDLADLRLAHGSVRSLGTPRRLAIQVEQLPAGQDDLVEERKGPPLAQAIVDGRPTAAATGFARRWGIEASELEIRETPKGAFVFAQYRRIGRPSSELLVERIPSWITELQGRRFMRWGQGVMRFSRPVRWLVALLDTQLLELQLEGSDPALHSSRDSRGHRLETTAVPIAHAADYVTALAAAGVQVDGSERARWIRQALGKAAEERGAHPELPSELFDELVDLVESPSLIEGSLDERFLALPPEVLSTVMRLHQRYVPLVATEASWDPLALSSEGRLLPCFLCIGNGLEAAADTVRRGNERVLKARLADAEFFWRADRSQRSESRLADLDRVTFAEGLGSLLDRTNRLEWLTDLLLELLPLEGDGAAHARRAARLCKHDLVSQLVGEFPELQGVIGAKLLLAEGEPRGVALAVLEHYLPRGAGDGLPTSGAGAVVALAERLEVLLSIFAKGERPTGSSDPYALRRAGNGMLQILWERGWPLDLGRLLSRASAHWQSLFPAFGVRAEDLANDLSQLLRQRLVSLLEEQGFAPDLVQAVAGETVPLGRLISDPTDALGRARLLAELRLEGRLAAVQAVVQRASRLAERACLASDVLSPEGVVDPSLFESPSEQGVLDVLLGLHSAATGAQRGRYRQLAAGLAEGAAALAAFFDGDISVMVMGDDPAVRGNRLNLLAVLRNQASVLADFSRLSG